MFFVMLYIYHFFVMLYISKLGGVGQGKNLKDCWVGQGKFIDVEWVGKKNFFDFGSFSSVPPPAINNDRVLNFFKQLSPCGCKWSRSFVY